MLPIFWQQNPFAEKWCFASNAKNCIKKFKSNARETWCMILASESWHILLRITSESLHATRTTKLYNRIIQQNVRTKSNQRLLRVKPCNHNLIFFNSTYIRTDWEEQSGKVWKRQAAANSLFFLCSFLANKSVNNIVTQRWTGAVSVIHVSTKL